MNNSGFVGPYSIKKVEKCHILSLYAYKMIML